MKKTLPLIGHLALKRKQANNELLQELKRLIDPNRFHDIEDEDIIIKDYRGHAWNIRNQFSNLNTLSIYLLNSIREVQVMTSHKGSDIVLCTYKSKSGYLTIFILSAGRKV